MTRYLLSRVGQAALVLWAAFTVGYILLQLLPGDSVLIKFQNPELGLSPEQIAEIRAYYSGGNPPSWTTCTLCSASPAAASATRSTPAPPWSNGWPRRCRRRPSWPRPDSCWRC